MNYKIKAFQLKVIVKVEKKEKIINDDSGHMVEGIVVAAPFRSDINISDKVIFEKEKSIEIKIDNITYNVIDEKEVLMVLKAVK